MLKKMTVENSEFNFEELLKEAEEKQITFEFTIKDKNDAIQTISTMGSIIKALFGQIDTYDEYLKVLAENSKKLHEENYNYFKTLINVRNVIDELGNCMTGLNNAITTTVLNEEEENEEEEW